MSATTNLITALDGLEAAQDARAIAGDELYVQTVAVFFRDGARHVLSPLVEEQLGDHEVYADLLDGYSALGDALAGGDANTVGAAVERLLELRTSLRDLRGF